jgi:hypothetical protein
VFAAAAFSACGDAENASRTPTGIAATDAARDRVISAADATSSDANLVFDGSISDVSELDASPPDAGEQPFVACRGDGSPSDADAADAEIANECEFPPSRCVDDRFLLYYQDGECIDGRCRWREEFYRCRLSCSGNGCNDNVTFPAAP